MVAPAPEEGSGEGEATPLPSKDSDSGESYKATQDDATVSQGDVETAVRVAQATDIYRSMFQMQQGQTSILHPKFLNNSQGPAKTNKGRQAPRMKGPSKTTGMKVTH